MRKLLLTILAVCSLSVSAELKTYDVEEGKSINSVIPYADMPRLDSLKVTGFIQQSDLYFINGLCRQFGVLVYVDLSEAKGLTEIPAAVFENVSTLKRIILPPTVTVIGDRAFSGCPKLEDVNIPEGVKTIGASAFLRDSLLKAAPLPQSLESVGAIAFMECKSWGPDLVLPKNLVSIGEGAFTYMKSLKNIKVDENNTAYKAIDNVLYTADGKKLLSCAGGLTGEINVAEGTEEIMYNAFAGAEHVTRVNLPGSVGIIGDYAFDFMYALEAINVDGSNSAYSSADGVLFDKARSVLLIYPQGAVAETYSTPSSVTMIGMAAFANNSHLRNIVLNEGLLSVGDYAFCESPLIETVALPSTLETLGQSVFTYCVSLKQIALPEGITAVPAYTFGECTGLTTVTLPSGVTEIDVAAFIGCTSMEAIDLPSGLKTIYNGAFQRTGLRSVDVPEGVTEIDINVFSHSDNLKTVVMPSTLNSIGGSSFDYTAVESFTCNAAVPPAADYAFMFADLSNATLTVPDGSVEKYKAAEGWKDFYKITSGIERSPLTESDNTVKAVYDLSGKKLDRERRGLNVIRYENGKTRVRLVK